jgi:hypothetical protein
MPWGIVQGINGSPGITPAAITGANNNYNPGAVPGATIWQDLSAAASLTGMAAMPADSEVTIVNISTTQVRVITLNHQNAGSSASNRFILPNGLDWYIPNGGSATFKYNGAVSRWYLKNWCGNHFPIGTAGNDGVTVGAIGSGLFHEGSRIALSFGSTDKAYWGAVNHNYQTVSVTGSISSSGNSARAGDIETQVSKTANYTIVSTDYFVACDPTSGAITITLPAAASSAGQTFAIRKINASANAVTIDPNAAELIDGAATLAVANNSTKQIICNGTAWLSLN